MGFSIDERCLPLVADLQEWLGDYAFETFRSSLEVESGEDLLVKISDFCTSLFAMVPYAAILA